MRVLVVDDEDSLRGALRTLLLEIGCDEVSFASCAEAPQLVRDGAADPDLILLDLDPMKVASTRRQLADLLPRLPIASITESTMETAFAILRAAQSHHVQREQQLTAQVHRLEQRNEDLERVVCIDPLTGIANRRHFDDLLAMEWRRATRLGTQLALVMIDLDDFHALNERYSHLGGDACLKSVAEAMAHCLRRPFDIVARYGGDEFVALLPDTDAAGAWRVAERLRIHVEQLQVPNAGSRYHPVVTLSVGMATSWPAADRSCESLVAAADLALFQAKREGRNRTCADAASAPAIAGGDAGGSPQALPRLVAQSIVASR